MKYIHSLVHENINNKAENFSGLAGPNVLQHSDRVFIWDTSFVGRDKFANRLKETVYVMVEKPCTNIPIYCIQPQSDRKK